MKTDITQDWLEIYNLRSAYSWGFDKPDFEGLMDLFADDAVLEFGPYGRWVGKEQIRAGYAGTMREPDDYCATIHVASNPYILIDGDKATGRWFLSDYNLNIPAGESIINAVGVYYDEYKKIDGKWKFSFIKLDLVYNRKYGRMDPKNAQKLDPVSKDK